MSIEFAAMSAPAAGVPPAKASLENGDDGSRDPRMLERAGADFLIVDHPDGVLANFEIAAEALRRTATLRVVLTHWAGALEPPEAARRIAQLSGLGEDRLALRVLSGDPSCRTGAAARSKAWEKTDEYLRLVRRIWLNDQPFDHEGAFYSLRGCYSPFKPAGADSIPVWIGDLSGAALKSAGRHADIAELPGIAVDEVKFLVARIRAAAAEVGRSHIRFAMPVRPSPSSADAATVLAAYAGAGVSIFNLVGAVAAIDVIEQRREIEDAIGSAGARNIVALAASGSARPHLPCDLNRSATVRTLLGNAHT